VDTWSHVLQMRNVVGTALSKTPPLLVRLRSYRIVHTVLCLEMAHARLQLQTFAEVDRYQDVHQIVSQLASGDQLRPKCNCTWHHRRKPQTPTGTWQDVGVAYLLNIRILGPVAPLTGQYSCGGLNWLVARPLGGYFCLVYLSFLFIVSILVVNRSL